MNGQELFEEIKQRYEESNKYMLKVSYEDIGKLIYFVEVLNKQLKYRKDKIKAKIEEYDDKEITRNLVNRSAGKTFQQAVHYEVKKVLQSLLEKE